MLRRYLTPVAMLLACAISVSLLVGKADAQALLLNEPSIGFSINDVQRLSQAGDTQASTPSSVLKAGEILATGARSRADLNFGKVQIRVGSKSKLSLDKARQLIDLQDGTYLVSVPDDAGEVSLKTQTINLTVRNSTFVVQQKAGVAKVFALTERSNGVLTVLRPDGKEIAKLKGGQLAEVESQRVRLRLFDVGEFFRTSSLFDGLRPGDKPGQSSPELLAATSAQLVPDVQTLTDAQRITFAPNTVGSLDAARSSVSTSTTAAIVGDPSSSVQTQNNDFLNNLVRTPEATKALQDRLNLGAASAKSDINDALNGIGSVNLPGNTSVEAATRLNNSLGIINSAASYNDQVRSQVLACLQGFTCR
jgi:hypothetical protein